MKLQFSFLLMVMLALAESYVEFGKSAFRVYRQLQRTTQANHIKLRFKTIHATGLIMFAQGANKKDFLSIELFRGKIRVAGNFANGTSNALRPILGQFDMYAGKDLADNQWHTVEYIRNIRQNIIYIDRGLGNKERFTFRKSPETYDELSVSMVTFGGYYSFATSDMSTQESLSRNGFRGCFSEALFSQDWWPQSERNNYPQAKYINFLQLIQNPPNTDPENVNRLSERMFDVGEIKQVLICSDTTPPYKPLYFKSSVVHLALLQNYTVPSMRMGMKFRTVVNDQTLANYTHVKTKESIELRINRKGNVVLQLDQDQRIKMIETAKEDYHNGEWHDVSFEIDNQQTSDKSYTIKFIVDGKTRFSSISDMIQFDGWINIGFGFTGCMRDIKINEEDIYRVRRSLTENSNQPFFNVTDVGIIHDYCSIRDFCNPNPCQNGGKCNQTDDNFVCNCKGTLYEGSTCHRPRFNYTCAGVRKSGERRSDVYYIDFDGMGPMRPVPALCDLGRTIEDTVTQINNTKRMDMDITTESGFNSVEVNYGASITQMRELIMNSASCKQFIKFTCKGSPLFNSPTGPPYVNWMGGDDVAHFYWGGAKDMRGYCECGRRGDCNVAGKPTGQYCNCDSLNLYNDIFDEGNFTIKEHLPVRAVNFLGKVNKNAVKALLRVGHLRCEGFGSHGISATFRKPYSYLSVYHPDQPFDNVQAGEVSFEFKTTEAYNYMTLAHAIGPFSGDYIKILIWSKSMMRVHLNLGFGDLKQDVDISSIGRTIDDNEWHEFSVMFNAKEMNVTLDGVRMIQGLPLQAEPVFFNVDATPLYIGGSYHDIFGFVGCIRSLYVNGRIFDIKAMAVGKEELGIYPGCGSACELLNRPCNYGECIDQYDSFKCNCSVSPYGGKYCQNETLPMSFSGQQNIKYQFNTTDKMATGKLVIGFKTQLPNLGLAQITGNNFRHFSLALVNGYPTLFWSLIQKGDTNTGSFYEKKTNQLQLVRKLDNNKHNIIKVILTTREITLSVPNLGVSVVGNVTETNVFNKNGILIGMKLEEFEVPKDIKIGVVEDSKIDSGTLSLPLSYTGCMSGAKFVYTPHATKAAPFPEAREYDFFKMVIDSTTNNNNNNNKNEEKLLDGNFPSLQTEPGCGPDLPIPGELPTVGPATQFFTKSPGLDNSVRIPPTDWVTQIVIVCAVLILSAVILGLLYVIYKKVGQSNREYQRIRAKDKPRSQPLKRMPPSQQPSSDQKQPSQSREYQFQPPTGPEGNSPPQNDAMFL